MPIEGSGFGGSPALCRTQPRGVWNVSPTLVAGISARAKNARATSLHRGIAGCAAGGSRPGG